MTASIAVQITLPSAAVKTAKRVTGKRSAQAAVLALITQSAKSHALIPGSKRFNSVDDLLEDAGVPYRVGY